MANYKSKDGLNLVELAEVENRLQQEGYLLTAKSNEKELLPGEYLKQSHSAFTHAFGGPVVWRIVWCLRQ